MPGAICSQRLHRGQNKSCLGSINQDGACVFKKLLYIEKVFRNSRENHTGFHFSEHNGFLLPCE